MQPKFTAPVRRVNTYPVSRSASAAASSDSDDDGDAGEDGQGGDDKHFVSLGWVLNHRAPLDDVTRLSLSLLDHLLLGTTSSPLR